MEGLASAGFMPHGHCYLWRAELLWLHVVSDMVITLAYYAIPVLLMVVVIRSGTRLPFNWVFLLFGLFIMACGTTHVMEIINVWNTKYLLSGVIKLFTAIVSILTAIETYRILPKVLAVLKEAEVR